MRNRAKNARLTTKQQKLLIKNALNDETVNEVLNNYRPSSVLTKIIAYALKNQKVNQNRYRSKKNKRYSAFVLYAVFTLLLFISHSSFLSSL